MNIDKKNVGVLTQENFKKIRNTEDGVSRGWSNNKKALVRCLYIGQEA
jgi:hypothetical protein